MAEDYSAQLKKAFRDLQLKVLDTDRRLQQGEILRKKQEQRLRIAELTKTQLLELDKDTPVYRSIGRTFARGTINSELARHDEEIVQAKERIDAIDQQKDYLQTSVIDAERDLREMVQSRPR